LGDGDKGGGDTKEKWENPYDKFYNTVAKINEELRERERLERRYQQLLDKTDTKASDLVKYAEKQLASLEKEKQMRTGLKANREKEMQEIMDENSKYNKYAWWDAENGVI
jgi:F0F1-type ATP synthase membrane subunit b/b'